MGIEYERVRDNSQLIDFILTSGCAPHFHQQVEILCVKSGEIDVTVNENSYRLQRGDICVSDSFDIHSYALASDPRPEGYVLIVPERHLAQYRTAAREKRLTENVLRDPAIYRNVQCLMEMICDCICAAGSAAAAYEKNDLLLGSLSKAIMAYVSGGLTYGECSGGTEKVELMRSVLSYLTEHSDEDITLPALSMRYGYTPNHFSHLFNAFVRRGLKEYLNDVRAENAAELMKSGKSVTDAAMTAGFTSMRTFYRSFELHFGSSPVRLLKKMDPEQGAAYGDAIPPTGVPKTHVKRADAAMVTAAQNEKG